MRKFKQALLFLLVTLFSAVCSLHTLQAQFEDQGIKFTSGKLKKVLKKAKKKGQMVFVDVTAEWCVPCEIMEESTFLDFHLGKLYNANFVNYKLDIDSKEGKKFKKKYAITFLPSFLYFDPNGNPQIKEHGSKTVEELTQLANEFISDHK